jgi:serine/threonine protein kinase
LDTPRSATLDPVLEYRDGVRRTWSGAAAGDEKRARVVQLPYSAKEILFRVGPYDVLTELGRGGMGTVYKGYSLRLARYVAIKIFSPRRRANEIDLLRFQNEVMLAARLRHPNIVVVHDSGEDDGRPYYVMDLIEDGSLANRIEKTETIPRSLLLALVKTARALHFAHEKGIVHRDIKPDNILIGEGDEPFVTDFGIAKDLIAAPDLTREGRALGTPFYMPPEQANGEIQHIGAHSDVYALGATLYHVIAGRPPFQRSGGDDEFVVLARILNEDPKPPSRVARAWAHREIPLDLETICLKAMEKEAARRYPTALAFANDLQAFLDGDEISARPASALERLQKRIRRNRVAWLSGVAVMLVLATLLASFGALSIESVRRTNESLVEKSRTDALHQAATLERAIRVNMLMGRADQARALMLLLNQAPDAGEIKVVRTDRQLAYTDPATRLRVQKWLNTPGVTEKIKRDHPDMESAVDVLQRVAFPKIDAAANAPETVSVEKEPWNRALLTGQPQHYSEVRGGTPYLVVLWPIENRAECRVCHSDPSGDSYANDPVRAVLLVRRSQAEVVRTVSENEKSTVRVGALTAGAFLVLIFFFARVLGFRPRRDPFGAVPRKS